MKVWFRFYGALNDFLPAPCRQRTLVHDFDSSASVKDAIESFGVPHAEVDRIAVSGRLVDFTYLVQNHDRIAVYPSFRTVDSGDAGRVGPPAQPMPSFVADVHLGRLSAYLRLAGFDTTYRNDFTDHELVEISAAEDRTVLTRDVGVLKHGKLTRGYFVRETEPGRQLVEVLRQFDLVALAAPFSRCLRCSTGLRPVPKHRIEALLEPRTRAHYNDFSQCPSCSRIYWQGSHYSRMRLFLEVAFAAAAGRKNGEDGGHGGNRQPHPSEHARAEGDG